MPLGVRDVGINPNHWYGVALSSRVGNSPLAVELWGRSIVLFRDSGGLAHALEDVCPHRLVKLSRGRVVNDQLECAYHGWCFDAQGRCRHIPYLEEGQSLPTRPIKTFPLVEQDGFVWIFLGRADLASSTPRFSIPEWEHLNYISSLTEFVAPCHFSFLIENLMDMYHGHLHHSYQAWAEPKLRSIVADENQVTAYYDAQSYYRVDPILSPLEFLFPALRKLHPESLQVNYCYPHWRASLGEDFRIYCLFIPIDRGQTRAFFLHFTSLERFKELHKLPRWFRMGVKNMFHNSARNLLKNLVNQDILMLQDEQNAHDRGAKNALEINRALIAVQKLIMSQSYCE